MKNTTELKIDSRKIGEKGQYAKRLDIIRLYFDECYSGPKIAEVLQVSKKYVYDIINNYKQGGLDALKIKKRGRAKGAKCTLSPEQETVIKDVIFNKKPKDFGLAEMLWSKENINLMIKSTIGISLSRSTLGDYLARWGYSPQRPIKKAYKQNPQKIEEWLNYTYPEIRKRALKEEAEILFGDETAIQNTTGYMRGYAPKNNPPVVDVASKKLKINMVSVISQKGVMRFSLFKVNMNAKRFLIFLKRVVHDKVNRDGHKKVFLILDNSRVHHAKLVQAWVNENRDKIELFFLPPYAPECNPDEFTQQLLETRSRESISFIRKTAREFSLQFFYRNSERRKIQLPLSFTQIAHFMQAENYKYLIGTTIEIFSFNKAFSIMRAVFSSSKAKVVAVAAVTVLALKVFLLYTAIIQKCQAMNTSAPDSK